MRTMKSGRTCKTKTPGAEDLIRPRIASSGRAASSCIDERDAGQTGGAGHLWGNKLAEARKGEGRRTAPANPQVASRFKALYQTFAN